ncbi:MULTISPECIES: anaerobic ribonucleoside-triphosphate reductase [Microbulbifer]|uniref:anaerobic ribonucleoside-triphosphate reductase n=1 Tax=Microbulbifer TaxID=48073 RepID=UPI001E5D364E|nr:MULTISPECIES: anaerobic ribonucleoside-triphosphate reductase [Microbulbifer]UHQ56547.1 anaerobic ribonucleoside-triphosphate reductase [Microbulbifer sp. YPW16]
MQDHTNLLNDEERTPCEIWSRVMGYHRPVSFWNPGKQSEHRERQYFVADNGKTPATGTATVAINP